MPEFAPAGREPAADLPALQQGAQEHALADRAHQQVPQGGRRERRRGGLPRVQADVQVGDCGGDGGPTGRDPEMTSDFPFKDYKFAHTCGTVSFPTCLMSSYFKVCMGGSFPDLILSYHSPSTATNTV